MAVKRRSLSRTLRYYYHRLFPRHERSIPVAVSVFLGVWIGLMPTLGIALILTAIAAQVARVPKGPGLLASFIAIPPTLFLFFYPLGYFGIGLPLVQPAAVDFDFLGQVQELNLMNAGQIAAHLWHDARGHLIAFLVGMVVVATGTGLLAFALTFVIMERKRRARLERRRLRRLEREAATRQPARPTSGTPSQAR